MEERRDMMGASQLCKLRYLVPALSRICVLSSLRAKFIRTIGRRAHLTCRRHNATVPVGARNQLPLALRLKLTEALCFDESYFCPLFLSHCSSLSLATSPATTRSPPASKPNFIPTRSSSPLPLTLQQRTVS